MHAERRKTVPVTRTSNREGTISGGNLAPSLGGCKKIFADPDFRKISIFTAKISDDLFLVIDQVFQIFSFLSLIFRNYVKCRLWPFPHMKNTFFYSVHTFARIRQHYFPKYWGDECMGRPHLKFGGNVPPVPLGLRPWARSPNSFHPPNTKVTFVSRSKS